jgi:Zn-dependent protease
MIALGFAFFIGAIFAAPGAVYIGGKKKRKWNEESRWDQEYPEYSKGKAMNEMGLISVAGVVINIILGFVFLGLLFFLPSFGVFDFILKMIFTLGYTINFILAGFNLLPFGPLDGKKVMQWNPIVWAVLFIPIAYWYFFLFR